MTLESNAFMYSRLIDYNDDLHRENADVEYYVRRLLLSMDHNESQSLQIGACWL